MNLLDTSIRQISELSVKVLRLTLLVSPERPPAQKSSESDITTCQKELKDFSLPIEYVAFCLSVGPGSLPSFPSTYPSCQVNNVIVNDTY